MDFNTLKKLFFNYNIFSATFQELMKTTMKIRSIF